MRKTTTGGHDGVARPRATRTTFEMRSGSSAEALGHATTIRTTIDRAGGGRRRMLLRSAIEVRLPGNKCASNGSFLQSHIQPLLVRGQAMKISVALFGLLLLMGSSVACGRKAEGPLVAKPAAAPQRVEDKAGQAPAGKEPADLPRKIIYNAAINLVVSDFTRAEEALKQLILSEKGYVVSSDVTGTPGMPRSGRWQVRVPAARADAFREGVIKLGELEKTRPIPRMSPRNTTISTPAFAI
jgi:hypothetical protein